MFSGSDAKLSAGPETVSAVVGRIKQHVESAFPFVWVVGEISSLSTSKGHLYVTLKDSGAQLKTVIWKSTADRIPFQLKIGMQVIVKGGLDLYAPFGEFKLVVRQIEPAGIGAAELALRQLKEKLLAKGYFDPDRKRLLPRYPLTIGLVTATTGAAIRDMLQQLDERWPIARVIVHQAKVQGDGAGAEIAAAIRQFGRLHQAGALTLDVLIVGRGGGSREDLAAFDEEIVADAIFASPMPVVTGIGHEIDQSVADLVADRKADTPTAAVAACTPKLDDLRLGLLNAGDRLATAIRNRLQVARQMLTRLTDRPAYRRPYDRLIERERRLAEKADRLTKQFAANLAIRREKVIAAAARLEAVSPLAVLTRGYSLTHRGDVIVRDAERLTIGDELTTRFARGVAVSTVTRLEST